MSSLFTSLSGLTLAAPGFLLLALLVPAALYLSRRRGQPAVLFAPGGFLGRQETRLLGASGLPAVPRTLKARLSRLPPWLTVLGLLLLVTALARPVVRVPIPEETEGIDILVCIDTSSSMSANDMDPERTRLDVAKAAAARFVADRRADRIGLILFSRYPDLRCPLTLDHDALAEILEGVELTESDGPEDATGIGTALARAAQALGGGEAESKVVILLTDGEENVATPDKPEEIAVLHAGQLCEQLGIRVYAITAGLGSRDAKGSWVPLDTSKVRRLAGRTGGRFYEARDAGAVKAVYAEIDELTKVEFAEPRYETSERFLGFLLAAVALLVLARFLAARFLAVLP